LITQVIHEHGEASCNGIDRGNLLIRPPELSENATVNHLVAKQEELVKEMLKFALRSVYFILRRDHLIFRNILRHGANSFTSPPEEGALRIFIALGRV
jgi:hypothetical protein